MQEALLGRLVARLGYEPFGPELRVVTAPAATLQWEREILRALGGGSLRLRVETPSRLAAEILADLGEMSASLSRAQTRALVRIVAARQATLGAFGDAEGGRHGAESLLTETLTAAWRQTPSLPEALAQVLGGRTFAALCAAERGVRQMAAEAGLVPESHLIWRAAERAQDLAWESESIFWPEGPLLEPEKALRQALETKGLLAKLPLMPHDAPRPEVAVEVRGAPDMRTEVHEAARRCLDLVRDGVALEEILIGCGDFGQQERLLRSALREAGIAADAGPEPSEGEPIMLCCRGILELARGEVRDALHHLLGSGMLPRPGSLRDSLVRHLRDGHAASGEAQEFLARLSQAVDAWPRVASFAEHCRQFRAIVEIANLEDRLQDPAMARQAAIAGSIDEQIDAIAAVAGEGAFERPLALRLLGDALAAARPGYEPRREAVRIVPVGEMHGLEADHVLLLGLAEGRFPPLAPSQSILRAGEMLEAEAMGFPLAEPLPERRQRGLLAVAAALGAARRSLYLSFAEIDGEGGVQAAAIRLRHLGEPLPYAPGRAAKAAARALSRQEAGELLAEAAGRQRDIGRPQEALLSLLAVHREACGEGAHLYGLRPAPPEERLGPMPLTFTVTGLERRAACPFISFAHDVLRVEREERAGFDPAARGALVHQVLKELPAAAPPADEQARLVQELVEQAAQAFGVLPLDTPQGLSLRQELATEVARTARLVWEETRRSGFTAAGREVAFGRRGDLPPLTVIGRDGQDIAIEGRIDRLDRLGRQLRVVDYKVRRRQPFSFARVYHGLDLQIGAYALAARLSGGDPVAMTYWPVRLGQSWVVDEGEDDPDGTWRQQRPRGLYLADPELPSALDREAPDGGSPFHPLRRKKNGELQRSEWALAEDRWQALLGRVERRLAELVQEAQDGRWSPAPFALGRQTACDGCSLRPACRHVPARDGYRWLRNVAQEVLDDASTDD